MVDFPIRVVVDPTQAVRGAKKVKGALRGVEKQAFSIGKIFRQVFAFAGIAFGLAKLRDLGDVAIEVTNRLRVAGIASADMAKATERLFNISNKTRTPIKANAQLFSRLALATGDLGKTTDEAFGFVELIGKALAIQGSSAREARGALTQLAQAIGSGIVRAEEFNSILEGGLPIAQAAAAGMGKSFSELRVAITKGQVTSKQFFEAIVSQGETIEALFAATTPTISQAFTILENNLVQLLSGLNSSTGALGLFSRALVFAANNLLTIINLAGVFFVAWSVNKIFNLVVSFAAWTKATFTMAATQAFLNKVMLIANGTFRLLAVAVRILTLGMVTLTIPMLAIVGIIGLVIFAIIKFGDAIKLSADGTVTLRTAFFALAAVVQFVVEVFAKFVFIVGRILALGFVAIIKGWLALFEGIAVLVGLIIQGFLDWIDVIVILTNKFVEIFPEAKAFFDFVADIINTIIGLFKDFVKGLQIIGRWLGIIGREAEDAFDKVTDGAADAAVGFGKIGGGAAKAAKKVTDKFKPLKNAIADPISAGTSSAITDLDAMGAAADRAAAKAASAASSSSASSRGGGGGGGTAPARESTAGGTGSFGASAGLKSLADLLGGATRTAGAISNVTGGGFRIQSFVDPVGMTREAALKKADQALKLLQSDSVPGIPQNQRGDAIDVVRQFRFKAAFLPKEGTPLAEGLITSGSFQRGGSFTVPGLGGGDTRRVGVDVAGGEKVSIKRSRDVASDDGGGVNIAKIEFNVSTPDAGSFRRNEQQITGQLIGRINKVARRL